MDVGKWDGITAREAAEGCCRVRMVGRGLISWTSRELIPSSELAVVVDVS